jgi:hypothetical protein
LRFAERFLVAGFLAARFPLAAGFGLGVPDAASCFGAAGAALFAAGSWSETGGRVSVTSRK